MKIEQFFDVYPWINISAFCRSIGVDRALMQRYREGLQVPEEWVIEKMQAYINAVAKKMIEKPLKQ